MSEHTPQFFLYDSELLDLGSAYNHYQALGTCALIKTIRYAFSCLVVLYNSILLFQFKSKHAIFLNNTFKSFWIVNVEYNTYTISYTIIYNQIMHFTMLFSIQLQSCFSITICQQFNIN